MTNPLRLALIGKSGSGKSEAANILAEEFGFRVVKTGLICRQIARLLFDNEDKRSMQVIDDALTKIDASIFLKAAIRGLQPDESFVIDALRFESDLNIARELQCTTVRIAAADHARVVRLSARGQAFELERDGRHRSEMELDRHNVDHLILNDGSLKELRDRISGIATTRPE